MARLTPLYPEFFEDVAATSHEFVHREEHVGDAGDLSPSPNQARAPWVGVRISDQEQMIALAPRDEVKAGAIPASASRIPFVAGETTVDAVAAYFPWHFFGDDWGIRIYDDHFLGYVAEIARATGTSDEALAPFVALQVLHHEWTHFAFEVVATELEDVTRTPLYGAYSRGRYARPTDFSDGPLEEAVATWQR